MAGRAAGRGCLGCRWLSGFGAKEAGVTELRIIITRMKIEDSKWDEITQGKGIE